MTGRIRSLLAIIGLILFFLVPVFSADLAQSDINEINHYKLTDKTLAQYFQATKNLIPVVQKNPRLQDDSDDSEGADSLNTLVQEFDAIPGAKKAVQDAGMATRDYLTFHFALFYAASGHLILKSGGQLPGEYSKENVEFYRANEAEFKKHEEDFKAINEFSNSESDKEDEKD
jgi:hypothetical protein